MRSKNQTMERVKFYNEMNSEMHGKGFKHTRLKRELDRLNPQSQAGSLIIGNGGVGAGISVAPTGGIPMHHKSTFLSMNESRRDEDLDGLLGRLKDDPLKRGMDNLRNLEDSLDIFVNS